MHRWLNLLFLQTNTTTAHNLNKNKGKKEVNKNRKQRALKIRRKHNNIKKNGEGRAPWPCGLMRQY